MVEVAVLTDTTVNDAPSAHLGACPWLALIGDDATHCSFPSADHRCRRARRPARISVPHQAAACLATDFRACPVYQQERPRPPAPARWPNRTTAALVTGAGATVLLMVGAAFLVQSAGVPPLEQARRPAAVTPTGGTVATSQPVPAEGRAVSGRPPRRYRVRADDTLQAVAAFFGAHPNDIITLNDLPADGTLMTGQEILIPPVP